MGGAIQSILQRLEVPPILFGTRFLLLSMVRTVFQQGSNSITLDQRREVVSYSIISEDPLSKADIVICRLVGRAVSTESD